MTRPVVLIGLDGATYDVLDPLLADGELPTLARLVERGARGVLRSVVPPITPAAWSSFMTGKNPGKHGVYDFRLYDPRAYCDTFVTSSALRAETMWELLTQAGRRVAVVNLPMMYPPREGSGTVVAGFDTPSPAAEFTLPRELRARILARIPDYSFVAVPDPTDPALESDDAFARFADQVERGFEQRTRVALDLLADGPWDVFMLHHQETDALQHPAWRFIAERGRHPERWARLGRVYRRLDALLGEVLGAVGPEALVLVLSDHGFGSHTGRLFPNVLLRRWGYLAWRGRRRERLKRALRRRLRRIGLLGARARADDPWELRVREHGFQRALPLRWRRTRAYVALAEIYGLLYLNLHGREPQGLVVPGAEQEALLAELRRLLLAVRDPRDGEPVFADVRGGADVYPEDPFGCRPDLVLVPRPGYTVYRDLKPRVWVDYHRLPAGTHRPEGILIVSGPGVRPGRLAGEAKLVDLAPTVLAAAGVAVPTDMDGRVLSELFVEPPAVTHAPPGADIARRTVALSEAEEEEVMQRLRSLGYVE